MTVTETRVQDLPPFAGHSPQQERPLGWYALLISAYAGLLGAFVAWLRRSGRKFRRVIGELIVCPYCLSMRFATLFTAGLLVAPRTTRWVASVLAIVFASDVLQIAYKRAEDAL